MKIKCGTCGEVVEARARQVIYTCGCLDDDTAVSVDGYGHVYTGRLGHWTDVFEEEDA